MTAIMGREVLRSYFHLPSLFWFSCSSKANGLTYFNTTILFTLETVSVIHFLIPPADVFSSCSKSDEKSKTPQ